MPDIDHAGFATAIQMRQAFSRHISIISENSSLSHICFATLLPTGGLGCKIRAARQSMNFLLKPELERFIAEKVKAGQYASADEIVNEALEILKEQDEFSPVHELILR